MNIPIHYLPSYLYQTLKVVPNLMTVHNFHSTADGWTTVLRCPQTGIEYRLDLTPIKSEVKVEELRYSDFEKGSK